ncbi:alpha/beta fold hydrolase [Peribacillus glennii]|uniref:Alpha/beta hydrolase n=1 Tax=Peribacillus glennii TaxID=2303991 RepID=A0A372L8Z8_9BACI|nr:alpha/beta hydrolase [Peribacillus glennii]RFU61985.1 alpha/beta hydrolase [Peribacillus glennii]
MKKQLFIDGKQVSYLDEGEAGWPAVLMVHGNPESSLLWKDIIPAVEKSGYRAIAPDLPGFGESDPFDGPSTWEAYVAFVSQFLGELNLRNVHLFVHDWGGGIGLMWACQNADKVRSLFITDTIFSPDYTWHTLAQQWRTTGVGEQIIQGMSDWEFWQAAMNKQIPGISEDVLADFFKVVAYPERKNVILDLYRSGDMEKVIPYKPKLREISGPVTIVWGEDDPYIPQEFGIRMKKEDFPQATFHLIPGAGHFIHIEAADAVCQLVEEHFKKI